MNNYKTKFVTKVYENVLSKKNSHIWALLRKILIKFWHDPECYLPIHGHMLYLPLSHALPQYLATLPLYDSLLRRLGTYMRQKDGYICAVDVGANIGDTIAAFFYNNYPQDMYLGVEPNPHFIKYLIRNWGNQEQVKILPYFCTADQKSTQKYRIVEYNGTAEILQSDSGILLDSRTLTQIIAEQPDFEKCNVIKIDTDGYDFDVISGAHNIIAKNHPAVIFECAPLDNENFVENCISILNFFANNGYSSFLGYDNIGNFLGRYSLTDLPTIKNLLFYQVTSRLFFIDMLVLNDKDTERFEMSEIDFFISKVKEPKMQLALNYIKHRYVR
jgi:FkbM family methyltransferase